MDERENPMVRDEYWPEYNSNYEDNDYLEWLDAQVDQARGK